MEPFPSTGKCIGHTVSIDEANRLAQQYQVQGFETKIFEKKEAGLILYEIWIFKKKEGLV